MPEQTYNVQFNYWMDEGEHHTQAINGDELTIVADASALPEGLHTLYYQLDNGALHTWRLYRVTPKTNSSLQWYRVWWNDHEDKAIEVQLPEGSRDYLYEETLVAPDYARGDGFTRTNTAVFHIVFADDQGRLSPVESVAVSYPDVYPPVTTLTATMQEDGSATLSWMANEDSVRDYNVYYSENGQPYLLWQPNTTRTEATFRGQKGTAYRFIVTARDQSGNHEAMDASRAVSVTFK